MQLIFSYFREYFRNTDKWMLLFCTCFAALLLAFNYRLGIETRWLHRLNGRWEKFLGFYCLYAIAFIIPCLLLAYRHHGGARQHPLFWLLLATTPALFALKVSCDGLTLRLAGNTGAWGRYYAIITNLPLLLVIVLVPLAIWRRWQHLPGSFYGLTTHNFNAYPYALLLVMMVPLVGFASMQQDFLQVYPRLRQVAFIDRLTPHSWWYKLLFEMSYGMDFLTIELFFRGFLVFAFVRYLGEDAVLPMAVFYCSIHFGKPEWECISSFFGGLLLGIIACRTQSILGGLVTHLGLAWMMELGGWLGHFFRK